MRGIYSRLAGGGYEWHFDDHQQRMGWPYPPSRRELSGRSVTGGFIFVNELLIVLL